MRIRAIKHNDNAVLHDLLPFRRRRRRGLDQKMKLGYGPEQGMDLELQGPLRDLQQ